MLIIPLNPVPSQVLRVNLANQLCEIRVYQKFFGLFLDLSIDNALVIGGVLCENLTRIVRSAYLGFQGDLIFIDQQGAADPSYAALGSRFILAYLDTNDLTAHGANA